MIVIKIPYIIILNRYNTIQYKKNNSFVKEMKIIFFLIILFNIPNFFYLQLSIKNTLTNLYIYIKSIIQHSIYKNNKKKEREKTENLLHKLKRIRKEES